MKNNTYLSAQIRMVWFRFVALLVLAFASLLITAVLYAADIIFIEHSIDDSFDAPRGIYAADMDGDGDLDVVGAALNEGTLVWWENGDGSGLAWEEHILPGYFAGGRDVQAGDVDGDGDVDIVAAAREGNEVAWWENVIGNGAIWAKYTADGSFEGAFDVDLADVDGNGDLDIVGVAAEGDAAAWWENTAGDGSAWLLHLIGPVKDPRDVAAVDIDADGDIDVLSVSRESNDVVWWENVDGIGGAWIKYTIDGDVDGANSVDSADVDGDGDLDVLATALNTGDVFWWENLSGNGDSWLKQVVTVNFADVVDVMAADLDGDGDMDVLTAGRSTHRVTWWENGAGNGLEWTEQTITDDFVGARTIYVADVNGDGMPDVLAAALDGDRMAWWENLPALLTVDDTSYNVRYGGIGDLGGWTGFTDTLALGGGYRVADSLGTFISYQSPAPTAALTLLTYRGPDQGKAYVFIDGAFTEILNLYAPAPQYQAAVEYGGLNPLQPHTIMVFASGLKSPFSSGREVRVDGFQMNSQTIDDNDPQVNYNAWRASLLPGALGGSFRHTARANASVSFSVNGTQFTWVTLRCPACGQAEVYVDGNLAATVDNYHPANQMQYEVVVGDLPPGIHEVQIRTLGTHDPASSGSMVVFDGYHVP
ncbi:MAG: hypothetical protein Fur0021_09470 [Candidatus Promineifilaceae bacterium]